MLCAEQNVDMKSNQCLCDLEWQTKMCQYRRNNAYMFIKRLHFMPICFIIPHGEKRLHFKDKPTLRRCNWHFMLNTCKESNLKDFDLYGLYPRWLARQLIKYRTEFLVQFKRLTYSTYFLMAMCIFWCQFNFNKISSDLTMTYK